MTRTKWKHRSLDDQERIYNDQLHMTRLPNRIASKMNINTPAGTDQAIQIYQDGEIPIYCLRCNHWTASDNYTLCDTPSNRVAMGIMHGQWYIYGNCRTCKDTIFRVFPHPLSSDGMIFMNALGLLEHADRVEDRRT